MIPAIPVFLEISLNPVSVEPPNSMSLKIQFRFNVLFLEKMA
jgi:hypothetical protein